MGEGFQSVSLPCNTMQPLKYVFFFAFAFCAVQAAEISRSAEKLELRIFVENGAAIAKTIFKAINTGFDQAMPNVDKIVNELAPEARLLIRRAINESRTKINEEERQVNHIFTTLTKALDTMKPIKVCWDKISPGAKKLALANEKEVAKIIQAVETKYKKEIDNIKKGTDKTVKKARTLFDTEVQAIIKCLAPGRKDANDCLTAEIEKTVKGVSDIAVDIIVLAQTAQETLSPMFPEVIEKLLPLLEKLVKDSRALIKTLADCVGTLKP